MNEYERPECYELLGRIVDWNSMLRDNEEDMNQLIYYLRTLEERQRNKYYQVLANEGKSLEDEENEQSRK